MATTDLGKVSLTPRGEYDPAAAYEALDVVSWQGGSYLALRAVRGVEPVGGEDYMVLTAKGDQGVSVDSIERTEGDGSPGTADTYTIMLSNGQTSTFKVHHGKDSDVTADVYDPQGRREDVYAYADAAVQEVKDNPTLVGGTPTVTTYTPEGGTEGVDYAVDVPGVTELYDGLMIEIIPHITSNNIKVRLTVNDLRTTAIALKHATELRGTGYPSSPDWMKTGNRYRLRYGMGGWALTDMLNISGDSISSPVPTNIGGTGLDLSNVAYCSYLATNGRGPMIPRTTGEIAVDIVNAFSFPTYTPEGYEDGQLFGIDLPPELTLWGLSDGVRITLTPHMDGDRTQEEIDILTSDAVAPVARRPSNDPLTLDFATGCLFRKNVPITLTWYASIFCFVAEGHQAVPADDIRGAIPAKGGGLGLDLTDTPVGSYPTTNGAEPVVLKTAAEVALDIDKASVYEMYTPDGGELGVEYVADVPGLTELYQGLTLKLKVCDESKSVVPTLNVNGLGAKQLRRYSASNTAATAKAGRTDWLWTQSIIQVMYNRSRWTVMGPVNVSASDIGGTVDTKNGGLGLDLTDAPVGSYPRTNGAEPMELVEPEQLAADVAPHLPHQAFDAAVAAGYTGTEEAFNAVLAGGPYLPRNGNLEGMRAGHLDIVKALVALAQAAGVAGPPIESFDHLLEQARKVRQGEDVFGLDGLTLAALDIDGIELRADFSGTSYVADDDPAAGTTPILSDFKTAITVIAQKFGSSITGMTQYELQYYLIHGTEKTVTENQAYKEGIGNKYYWWQLEGGPEAVTIDTTNLDTLIDAAYRAVFNGNPVAWDGLTTVDQISAFYLVAGFDNSTDLVFGDLEPFTSVSDFTTAMDKLVKEAVEKSVSAGGAEHAYIQPTLTWYQIQHALAGNGFAEDADIPNKEDTYWWIKRDSNPALSEKKSAFDVLLERMGLYVQSTPLDITILSDAYGREWPGLNKSAEALAKVKSNDDWSFRRLESGVVYTTVFVNSQILPRIAAMAEEAMTNPEYYSNGKCTLTWYQIQHYLVKQAPILSAADAESTVEKWITDSGKTDWRPSWLPVPALIEEVSNV